VREAQVGASGNLGAGATNATATAGNGNAAKGNKGKGKKGKGKKGKGAAAKGKVSAAFCFLFEPKCQHVFPHGNNAITTGF